MAGATSTGPSAAMGLTVGKLPSGGTHIVKQTRKLRTALEQAIIATKGSISITAASAINVACRAEMSAKLAQKWLSEHEGSMEHPERLAYIKTITTASEARHKAIASLHLDDVDPMADLLNGFAAESPAEQTPPPVPSQDGPCVSEESYPVNISP